MPSPGYPLGRNGDGAVLSGPVAERLARCTGLRDGAAYDQKNPDIPEVRVAASMPRTSKAAHEMPEEIETGADEDVDLGELVEQLYRQCHARGLPTRDIEHALEPLMVHSEGGNGDAGVPSRYSAEDAEPLDGEVVEKIMKHLDGRLSPAALGQLKEMLEGGRMNTTGCRPVCGTRLLAISLSGRSSTWTRTLRATSWRTSTRSS
jgi:hypothetical protein